MFQQTRNNTEMMDWTKCIFCQEVDDENTHFTQSFNTSRKTSKTFQNDQNLEVGVKDFIAAKED